MLFLGGVIWGSWNFLVFFFFAQLKKLMHSVFLNNRQLKIKIFSNTFKYYIGILKICFIVNFYHSLNLIENPGFKSITFSMQSVLTGMRIGRKCS